MWWPCFPVVYHVKRQLERRPQNAGKSAVRCAPPPHQGNDSAASKRENSPMRKNSQWTWDSALPSPVAIWMTAVASQHSQVWEAQSATRERLSWRWLDFPGWILAAWKSATSKQKKLLRANKKNILEIIHKKYISNVGRKKRADYSEGCLEEKLKKWYR